MPVWLSLYFQNSCSFVMEQLIFFHDHVMMVLVVVMIMVGYLLMFSYCFKVVSKYHVSAHVLESVWTLVPVVLLMMVAFPSLHLLYLMEESGDCELNIKVMGHQWYWSYEYSDFLGVEYDSYLLEESGVMFRLLEVSNCLVLPMLTNIRLLVTSSDVIHAWTLPSVGVKTDAVPGRLNQIFMMINRLGLYVGQCSEICGLNHSFMPIVVFVTTKLGFLSNVM